MAVTKSSLVRKLGTLALSWRDSCMQEAKQNEGAFMPMSIALLHCACQGEHATFSNEGINVVC